MMERATEGLESAWVPRGVLGSSCRQEVRYVGGRSSDERTERLGQLIRRLREERGLSQEDLAALVGGGISQSIISRIERGVLGLPNYDRLTRIADVLGADAGDLMARSGWAKFEGPSHNNDGAPEGAVSADPLSELSERIWPRLSVADQAILVRIARVMAQEHRRR